MKYQISQLFKGKVTRDKQALSMYRDMEQNKGKGNDTLENGLEDYCKTTIETGRINPLGVQIS